MRKKRMLEAKVFIRAGKKTCCDCRFEYLWTRSASVERRECVLFSLDLKHGGKSTYRTQACLLSDRSYDD